MSNIHPIMEQALAPFRPFQSRKLKSWEKKQGGMTVKVDIHQDSPDCYEVACYRLGQSIPVIYKFSTLEAANHRYEAFVDFHIDTDSIEQKLAAELEMLHSLCASAQCWLDAAGYLATNYETKCALQKNADAFRQAYAKITS